MGIYKSCFHEIFMNFSCFVGIVQWVLTVFIHKSVNEILAYYFFVFSVFSNLRTEVTQQNLYVFRNICHNFLEFGPELFGVLWVFSGIYVCGCLDFDQGVLLGALYVHGHEAVVYGRDFSNRVDYILMYHKGHAQKLLTVYAQLLATCLSVLILKI